MNMSTGNTRCFRIVFKVLAILLALFLLAIWCANWEEGSLPVDGKLVNREALQAILDYSKSLDSVYMRSSQNSQPNSDTPDMNSRKER